MLINLLEEEISIQKATPGGPPSNVLIHKDSVNGGGGGGDGGGGGGGGGAASSHSPVKGLSDDAMSSWTPKQGKVKPYL